MADINEAEAPHNTFDVRLLSSPKNMSPRFGVL